MPYHCSKSSYLYTYKKKTPKKKKTVGKYELGKVLGEGTFGKVQLGTHIETGEKVAIKILSKAKLQQQNMGSQIKKEISIMKLVNHPNVCNLVEVLASRNKIFIVLELDNTICTAPIAISCINCRRR